MEAATTGSGDMTGSADVSNARGSYDAGTSRAIIIAHGRIVADDTPQGLAARSRYHNAVSLRLERPAQLAAARTALSALPQVASIEVDEPTLRLTALPRDGAPLLAEVNAIAARESLALRTLELEPGRLDEVFRGITT